MNFSAKLRFYFHICKRFRGKVTEKVRGPRTLSRKDLCKSVNWKSAAEGKAKSVGIVPCPTDFTDLHRFLAWILGHADHADDADTIGSICHGERVAYRPFLANQGYRRIHYIPHYIILMEYVCTEIPLHNVKYHIWNAYSQTKNWHFGMKLVILQQQFLPRLFLKAYHGRTSCFMQNHIDLRLIAVSLLQLICMSSTEKFTPHALNNS